MIPHWRPFAFSIEQSKKPTAKSRFVQNVLFQENFNDVARLIFSEMAVGKFYDEEMYNWGYTAMRDGSGKENNFSSLFGFNVCLGTTIDSKRLRTRKILTCEPNEVRAAFVRFPTDRAQTITTLDLFVDYDCTVRFSNAYGDFDIATMTMDHLFTAQTEPIKNTQQMFVILFKRGIGTEKASDNSKMIIEECRDNFFFFDVRYSLNNLIKTKGYDSSTRRLRLEYVHRGWKDEQIQAILRNALN
jgi:hypothetical protein